MPRPSVTKAIDDLFSAYHASNPTWGCLHVVLDDENFEDRHVENCIEYAAQERDYMGTALAALLLRMSLDERADISRRL